jgi:hypothetical protein
MPGSGKNDKDVMLSRFGLQRPTEGLDHKGLSGFEMPLPSERRGGQSRW